jgi:hypothetical protein
MNTTKNIFTEIYDNRKWDSADSQNDSVSGPGSSLLHTVNIRKELPELLKTFKITTVFDAPCGDLNWMSKVLEQCPDIEYVGGDIVDALIETNREKYSDKFNAKFVTIDITKDELPNSELMICRECLFHLSNKDIMAFLNNFLKSDISALLMTSDLTPDKNFDIDTGGFRWVNFFQAPWNFEANQIYTINDWPYPTPPSRQMYLWSREQIEDFVSKIKID